MPTYQYACTACSHRFDAVQAFTDEALTECPECGGQLRKLYGAVGVVFKGSGFYRTDSRAASNGSAKSGKSDGDGSAKSTASGDGKAPASKPADSKPSSSSSGSSSSTAGSAA